jgi:tRNA-dihydrouridine synthase B
MAGFTDSPMRRMCRRCGADVVVSEFVMANAILGAGDDSQIWKILSFTEGERPVGLQLFGPDPELMAAAAQKLEARLHPDFIDLNCGCPSPKIVGQNAGSALMKDLPRMEQIARAMVCAVPHTPVTAKIRTGWDSESIVAVEAAKRLEGAGVSALSVHGRTRAQGYGGDADWNVIGEVVKSVKIPVVGNGSVGGIYPVACIRDSGVAGAMVGRAALGNPWVFTQLRSALDGLPAPLPPTPKERITAMLEYARELRADGEDIPGLRAKLKTFIRDMRGARAARHALDEAATIEQLERLVETIA